MCMPWVVTGLVYRNLCFSMTLTQVGQLPHFARGWLQVFTCDMQIACSLYQYQQRILRQNLWHEIEGKKTFVNLCQTCVQRVPSTQVCLLRTPMIFFLFPMCDLHVHRHRLTHIFARELAYHTTSLSVNNSSLHVEDGPITLWYNILCTYSLKQVSSQGDFSAAKFR